MTGEGAGAGGGVHFNTENKRHITVKKIQGGFRTI